MLNGRIVPFALSQGRLTRFLFVCITYCLDLSLGAWKRDGNDTWTERGILSTLGMERDRYVPKDLVFVLVLFSRAVLSSGTAGLMNTTRSTFLLIVIMYAAARFELKRCCTESSCQGCTNVLLMCRSAMYESAIVIRGEYGSSR